jgi:hypothetical protein
VIGILTIHYSLLTILFFVFAIPNLLTAQLLAGVMGWVILWRERYDGYGVPGGLPLIVRFFLPRLKPFPFGRGQGGGRLAPFCNGEPSSSSTLVAYK